MRGRINQRLVKERMRAGGWSQEALAEATGIDPGNLHRLLNGQQEPRVGTAILLARCLEVRVEDLFVVEDPRGSSGCVCAGRKGLTFRGPWHKMGQPCFGGGVRLLVLGRTRIGKVWGIFTCVCQNVR